MEAPNVKPIQGKDRQPAWERFRVPAVEPKETLPHSQPFAEKLAGEPAPVIEIAPDHQRRSGRNNFLHSGAKLLKLSLPARFKKGKVNAYNVKRNWQPRKLDHGVEKPPALKAAGAHVLVFPVSDGVLAENGIPVMPGLVNRILSVGEMGPKTIG